eukprot:CAMPEP_0119376956 /NCGR_PEP_ID=MMETSP1334-20130426/42289_1 /TAXON_ID=127549 /ORGANISM="Calcidiscus leptoporus, Strain RCC1130" /LENGTH=64 /DNA_ID=CAMNT_0007395693 /DNA_START=494 /DNA_END=688 /DNA_ORIENTATION=-
MGSTRAATTLEIQRGASRHTCLTVHIDTEYSNQPEAPGGQHMHMHAAAASAMLPHGTTLQPAAA